MSETETTKTPSTADKVSENTGYVSSDGEQTDPRKPIPVEHIA